MTEHLQQYLEPTDYFDYNHPAVQALLDKFLDGDESDDLAVAIKLYNGVRDSYHYNPYQFSIDPNQFKASYCAEAEESYCIPKAVLFGALCRAKGIPARLGLADVKNHISSPRLTKLLQSDVFVMHGYTDVFLNGKWVKATPAFDSGLCKRIGIHALGFDGKEDSVFQEFNLDGNKHMEYLKDHGTFADVPAMQIYQAVGEAYPHLRKAYEQGKLSDVDSLENDLPVT